MKFSPGQACPVKKMKILAIVAFASNRGMKGFNDSVGTPKLTRDPSLSFSSVSWTVSQRTLYFVIEYSIPFNGSLNSCLGRLLILGIIYDLFE